MSTLRLLGVAAILFTGQGNLRAETDFNIVGREVAGMLQNHHYAKIRFDRNLSARILNTYLEDLDPSRLLFTEADVADFKEKYGGVLHELLLKKRSMEPAIEIYQRVQRRVRERDAVVRIALAEDKFSFEGEDAVLRSRDDAKRPATLVEAREIWLRRLKREVLAETLRREVAERKALAGGESKEDEGKEKEVLAVVELLGQKYERVLRTVLAATKEDIADYFFSAVAASYGPHTDYLSMAEQERFMTKMSNSLVGIGATLQEEDDGSVRVEAIVIGGPADRSGELQLNDRIVAVDEHNAGAAGMTDVRYMRIDKVVGMIKGKEKTKVRLKVQPAEAAPGVLKEVTIERGKVEHKSQQVTAELIVSKDPALGGPRLGYVRVPSFYLDFRDGVPSVSRDIAALLTRLNKERIDGLVVDLQGNGGGSLEEVIKIAGFFLGARPVVQVRDAKGAVETRSSTLGRPLYSGPLVLLTDKASASASEILAAALQDYNRAVVIGSSSTYGKGTVQLQLDVGRYFPVYADARRAGWLKPTIQKYYRVSGSSVQLVGVRPDIVLPSRYDAEEFGEAFLRYPLAHDTVRPSRRFVALAGEGLHVDRLKEKSELRIDASRDFQYLREDNGRTQTAREVNAIALNLGVRRAEIEESAKRWEARRAERKKRFALMAETDAVRFAFYELNLDNVGAEELPEIGPERERSEYLRRASDLDENDDALTWPNGLSPAKRESLAVAADLIELREASKLAGKTPKA